jgi:hypothetical protein
LRRARVVRLRPVADVARRVRPRVAFFAAAERVVRDRVAAVRPLRRAPAPRVLRPAVEVRLPARFLRPLPAFRPPPVCLLTVAQARAAATSSETPRDS